MILIRTTTCKSTNHLPYELSRNGLALEGEASSQFMTYLIKIRHIGMDKYHTRQCLHHNMKVGTRTT
jgi:hypothetical protein